MNSHTHLNSDVYSGVYRGVNRGVNKGVNKGVNRNVIRRANSVDHNNTHHGEHYTTMDLCSQAHMLEDADNILSRMDKLRAYAREQQSKRVKSQRQQTSFCF